MRQRAETKRNGRRYAVIVLIACVVVLLLRPGCHREPPDLTACTRIEVRYTYGALYYFFRYSPMQKRMLSEEERQYVRSFDKWTVTDQEQIRAFAELIRQGTYRGIMSGNILDVPVDITCYQGRSRVASFSIYPTMPTVIANGRKFSYQPGFPILRSLNPPGLKPLQARWECATRLDRLLSEGLWQGLDRSPCPDPNHWCDVIVRTVREVHTTRYELDGKRRRQYPDRVIARGFTCPGIHPPTDVNDAQLQPGETDSSSQTPDSWVSDYAMNSNCRDGSPDDMVFLFESKPGWNQHGGPELFTFDNHDPKGGCVLLNDGKVKFIRTKEELHALRWK